MRVELIPLEGGEPVRLVNAVSVLGRHQQTCNVCMPQSGVSKQHCVILQTETAVLLRDLGSTNGTRINSKQVDGEQELHNDDLLALGKSEFRVHIDFDAEPADDTATSAGDEARQDSQEESQTSAEETLESPEQDEHSAAAAPAVAEQPLDEPRAAAEVEPQETDGESPSDDASPPSAEEEQKVAEGETRISDEEQQATDDDAESAGAEPEGSPDDKKVKAPVADETPPPAPKRDASPAGSSTKRRRDQPKRRSEKQRGGQRRDRISEAQVLAILNEGGDEDDHPQLPQLQVKHEPQAAPAEPAAEPSPEPPPPPPKPESPLLRRKAPAPVPEETPQSATGAAANEVLGADRTKQARRLLVEQEEPEQERRSLREFLEPVLKDRFTIIAVVAAVLALLIFWPWGSAGTKYYETYQTVWAGLKERRERNASKQEWDEFRLEARAELEPMIKELNKKANSKLPLLQELLFAGRDALLYMLDDARTEVSASERKFIEHMELARKMMDSGDPDRIYREWIREQHSQRQREAQAQQAESEEEEGENDGDEDS